MINAMQQAPPTRKRSQLCYCINVRRAANRITDFYDSLLTPFGISINQFCILNNLSLMSGCGTGELADQLQLEKSTLVRSLKPLQQAGYIEDTSAPGSRARQLRLTDAGEKLLAEAKPSWEEAQKRIKAKFGSEEIKRLMQLLNELA